MGLIGHNFLYEGPPGCGKSMLAQRLPGILPPMHHNDALTQLAIRSISRQPLITGDWCQRPFRAPHHSASVAALVGGGNPPNPGEISLAHQGVLFLDELAEFPRSVLEAMREPLETGSISISRAGRQVVYPANFMLLAAMNPCPCGYLGDLQRQCRCSADQVQRYRRKISGPLLDRIDLHLALQPTPLDLITRPQADPEQSADIRARVIAAREQQLARQGCCNAALDGKALQAMAQMPESSLALLEKMAARLMLSARALQRTLRVARTIADLEHSQQLLPQHISEACSYRQSHNA